MIYEYKCNVCGEKFEAWAEVEKRHEMRHCGQTAKKLISKSQSKPVVMEYFSENLDAQITGPRQKARVMKEKDVSEVG
jgi:putative FmdB family regulatory protein